MIVRVVLMALAATFFSPLMAEAQLQLRTNGTAFRVHNASKDGVRAQVNIKVDGKKEESFILSHGQTLNRTVHCGLLGGWLQEYSSCDVVVTVRACEAPVAYTVFPADWIQAKLGNLAITPEFLASLAAAEDEEAAIKDRVREIKDDLDRRKVLGRDRLKEGLDQWSKSVRRGGYVQENLCPGGEQSAWQNVAWDNFYHGSVVAIWITGTKRSLELGPWLGR